MAYDLLGVCRLIVNYSNEKEYNISNLKLQKLLFGEKRYRIIYRPISLSKRKGHASTKISRRQ